MALVLKHALLILKRKRVVNVDKNVAYPNAFDNLKANETLPETTELRQNKYLNNRLEQDLPRYGKTVNA